MKNAWKGRDGKRLMLMRGTRIPLIVCAAAMLVGGLAWGVPVGVPLSSDCNTSAVLTDVWTSFPLADGPGELSLTYPRTMCVDSTRRLFITDLGPSGGAYTEERSILVLNQDLRIEAVIGSSNHSTISIPEIVGPGDMAIDSQDRLYITDWVTNQVNILSRDLDYLGSVRMPEDGGAAWCIALDSQDRLIVADYRGLGQSRILVFSRNQSDREGFSMVLDRTFQLCPPGEDCSPRSYGIIWDVSVGPDGRIYIAETSLQYMKVERVVVFDKDFNWLFAIGSKVGDQQPDVFNNMGQVAVDRSGVIVVEDEGRDILSFFFPNGTHAGRIGWGGAESTQLSRIGDLLSTQEGVLLASERGSDSIVRIMVDLSSLRPTKLIGESVGALWMMLLAVSVVGIGLCMRRPHPMGPLS